jgi:hypothetical protein
MKKLFVTMVALGLGAGLPQAAHAMECCEDGTCECCKNEEDTAEPSTQGAHQH